MNTLEKADSSGAQGILSFHRKKPCAESSNYGGEEEKKGPHDFIHRFPCIHMYIGFKLRVIKVILVVTEARNKYIHTAYLQYVKVIHARWH